MASPKLKKTSVSHHHPHPGHNHDDVRAAVRATKFVSSRRRNRSSPRSSSSPSRFDGLEDSPPFSSVHDRRSASLAHDSALPTQSTSKQTWINNSPDSSDMASYRGMGNGRSFSGYPSRTEKEKSIKHKANIRSHLKRSTNGGSTSIDLDRSALENEGLGIYTNLERDRRYADNSLSRRGASTSHNRSTSGTSQYSGVTSNSLHKPGSQYVHPMRQTPRPYTPPIAHSYQNSVMGSEHSADAGKFSTDLDDVTSIHRELFVPISSGPSAETKPYQIQTSSMTNVTIPSSLNHTRESYETVSPLSRSSLDFAFRSRVRTNTDPAARVAAVQAARQAFEDKEAAKNRKLEKQSMKAYDRQLRRQEKKEQPLSTSSSQDAAPTEKRTSFGGGRRPLNEKSAKSSSEYSHNNISRSFESPKSAWVLFITWLRTKLFKMGRKLKRKKRD
ncbi:hypothetical protein AJ79_04742 [Helicocarpus griseus UAMH5409]|uniref:Uncharacterized protein n=1 Tax=Helicocarpus griseus UAMH5409 TaxID=1447875 RepID=A0A2B7XRY5_9EURO|nr:hypothetical protein AJ79_04742 [Helicocarpus griseus UAMH5409]